MSSKTFKQYLTEVEFDAGKVTHRLSVPLNSVYDYIHKQYDTPKLKAITKIVLREIGELCTAEGILKPTEFITANDQCYFWLELTAGHYSKTQLINYRDKFRTIAEKYFDNKFKRDTTPLIINIKLLEKTVPTGVSFEADTTNIFCKPLTDITLKNIEKVILQSDNVNIYEGNTITGNVLGLLKINGLDKITDMEQSQPFRSEWIRILNDNRSDILECKEALINAGYKEFAKL